MTFFPPPMTPLQVEVITQIDWWQPYLPPLIALVGSLIAASAAFAGVLKSNRTNQRAIESADERERDRWKVDSEREREKWHRDNLMRLCSEALRLTREIQQNYTEAAAACTAASDRDEAQRAFQEQMNAAQAASTR